MLSSGICDFSSMSCHLFLQSSDGLKLQLVIKCMLFISHLWSDRIWISGNRNFVYVLFLELLNNYMVNNK